MKVFFNNSCKICRSEINLYKKENIKDIDWIDITNNSDAEKETLRIKKSKEKSLLSNPSPSKNITDDKKLLIK